MKWSEINALGQSLRRIDQALLNQAKTAHSERIWYQGGEPYFDVFIERHQEAVEWFQITLRGRSLSWHRQHNHWHTGHTNEMQADDLSFYPASKVIESDQRPDRQFFQTIEAILQCRAGEGVFDQLLAIFATAHTQAVLD